MEATKVSGTVLRPCYLDKSQKPKGRKTVPDTFVAVFVADDVIQALKDRVQALLLRRAALDPATGCWDYDGACDPRAGEARIWVAGRAWNVSRVAAWIYWDGQAWEGEPGTPPPFELEDPRVRVQRRCRNARCCNFEHLARLDCKQKTVSGTVLPKGRKTVPDTVFCFAAA